MLSSKIIFLGSSWTDKTSNFVEKLAKAIAKLIEGVHPREWIHAISIIPKGPFNWKTLLESYWFPLSITTIVFLLIYLRRQALAASLFLLTCGLYIFEYIVPEIRDGLGGMLIFVITVGVTATVAIYYLLIKEN